MTFPVREFFFVPTFLSLRQRIRLWSKDRAKMEIRAVRSSVIQAAVRLLRLTIPAGGGASPGGRVLTSLLMKRSRRRQTTGVDNPGGPMISIVQPSVRRENDVSAATTTPAGKPMAAIKNIIIFALFDKNNPQISPLVLNMTVPREFTGA